MVRLICKLVLIFFLLFSCNSDEKKYYSHIIYDSLVDKIFHYESNITSNSFMFGDIKSYHIIDSNFVLSTSSSIKVYFDEFTTIESNFNGKRIDKISYFGKDISKNGYANDIYKGIYEVFESTIDKSQKLAIQRTYTNKKLSHLDSIYFTDDLKPKFILKYMVQNDSLKLVEKHIKEYNGDRGHLDLHIRDNGSYGWKKYYTSEGKYHYMCYLTDINNETYTYKEEMANCWYFEFDGNDFKYFCNGEDTLEYAHKTKMLVEKSWKGKTFVYFNDEYFPTRKEVYYNDDKKISQVTIYNYTKQGDISSIINNDLFERVSSIQRSFIYKYDEKNNWTERLEYENKELVNKTIRIIEYFR